jgi:hypothetical protein
LGRFVAARLTGTSYNGDSVFRKIGFFNFGNPDKSRPLDSLEDSIRTCLTDRGEGYLKGSLLVLPEAFNLKGEYEQRDR